MADQKEMDQYRWRDLEVLRREAVGVVNQYAEDTGLIISQEWALNPVIQGDYIIHSDTNFLIFPRRKPVVKVTPPYNVAQVQTLDPKFLELGQQIRDEFGLFWKFGPRYMYEDEKLAQRKYENRLLMKAGVNRELADVSETALLNDLSTDEYLNFEGKMKKAVLEMVKEDIMERAKSRS